MAMAPASTSKTPTIPSPNWEVHGEFDFSPDGRLAVRVRATVYVEAPTASEASCQAVEMMGTNAVVKKVFQMWEGKDE